MSRPLNKRYMTIGYVVSLALIACLSLVSHVTMLSAIDEQDGAAEVINVAGRQRMLSQRIVLFTELYTHNQRVEYRQVAEAAIDLMEKQHLSLTAPPGPLGLASLDAPDVLALYDSGLREDVFAFLNMAREALSTEDVVQRQVLIRSMARLAQEDLLKPLNQAVLLYEEGTQGSVDDLRAIALNTLYAVMFVLFAEAVLIFRPLVNKLTDLAQKLYRLAMTDSLTGLQNRRAFFEQANALLSQKDGQKGICLAVVDIDHFKHVNDEYGHDVGDKALRHVSRILLESLDHSDVLGRVGGEEFLILLPDSALADARQTVERLRSRLEDRPLVSKKSVIPLTVSIGVAELSGTENLESIVRRADQALYKAKEAGRNRVVLATAAEV